MPKKPNHPDAPMTPDELEDYRRWTEEASGDIATGSKKSKRLNVLPVVIPQLRGTAEYGAKLKQLAISGGFATVTQFVAAAVAEWAERRGETLPVRAQPHGTNRHGTPKDGQDSG